LVLFITFNDVYLGERAFIIGDKVEDSSVEFWIFVGEVIINDSFIAEVSSSS
jgi:hypothetical protein